LHKVFKAVIDLEKVEIDVMKPGMTARIEVPVSFASQVVAVPREYLGIDEGKYFVQKGTDSKTASRQVVEVGSYSDRLIQILSGVNVGDRLLPVQKPLEAKP
jgi:multidrug efflux pump subunit AcrA (membrane-fusion protein)